MPNLTRSAGKQSLQTPGILLSDDPAVYMAALPGPWLLSHSTPSWRIEDPIRGFQRLVKTRRAKDIAGTVLDQHRTFPNAITLATTSKAFELENHILELPAKSKFLVVDGQHRLWAQYHSKVSGIYPCIIHMDCTESEMASLFLEINDNQKRVPSSLRWDLVRLVQDGDQAKLMAADLVYALATSTDSPFVDTGLDLTGEKKEFTIKQGSLAPEFHTLVRRNLKKGGFEEFYDLLVRFFVTIRSLDPDGWGDPQSTFYKARVLRALIRVLSDLLETHSIRALTTAKLRTYFNRIDRSLLTPEELRRVQGSTGVQDLYRQVRSQVVGDE